jgi:MFS-type transporter involved in bile tolerance (Atg22 family)
VNYAFLFMLAGVETGAIDAGERSYAADLLGENNRGTGFGVLSTVNGIGDFVSNVMAGVLWTLIFPSAAFYYGAVLAAAAAALLIIRKSAER